MLNLVKIKVDRVGAIEIPGYKRGAWFTEARHGVEVKNVYANYKACFIVYQSKKDPSDVFVELKFLSNFTDIMRPVVVSIPAESIKKFVGNSIYGYSFVDRDGHVFINGLTSPCNGLLNPSEELCRNTYAFKFMESFWDELAIVATFPDKVRTFEEALEVYTMLDRVARFVDEIEDDNGSIKSQKQSIMNNIGYNRSRLESVEQSMNECHESNRETRETLLKFGIDPDNNVKYS